MIKNWKTTLAGLAVIVLTSASAMGWISHEVAASIVALMVSLGLIAAKDNNVTGGTINQ